MVCLWCPAEFKLKILIIVDPLIAKVMVHACDRVSTCRKMTKVLSETTLQGPPTNIHFLKDVISSKRKCGCLKIWHSFQIYILTLK